MGQQPSRRGIGAAIAAVCLWVGACGGGSAGSATSETALGGTFESEALEVSTATTAAATDTATLRAETAGVLVDGVEVPSGETRPVAVDQQIVLGPLARARLRVGELETLLRAATARLVSWAPREIGLHLESGVLDSTLTSGSLAHLLLTTSSRTTIRTVQPGTRIWVCQGPGVTCACVRKGAAEWEQQGEIEQYVPMQCSFALAEQPPQPAKCLPVGVLETWFQQVEGDGAFADLGALVSTAPPCPAETPPPTTPASTQDTREPGTTSRQRPSPESTSGTPAPTPTPTTHPPTTQPPTTQPPTTQPPTTQPPTTQPPTTQPPTTQPVTTAPPGT